MRRVLANILRVAVALLPLALSPLLLHLFAYGIIDLGGGEKDIVWLFPWVLWSLIFAASSFVLWYRGWRFARSFVTSAIVGLAGVVTVAFALAAVGQLGVGGRF